MSHDAGQDSGETHPAQGARANMAHIEGKPMTPPNPPRSFVVQAPIGSTPGYIWVQNDDGSDLGRVFIVRMRFGKEVERVRLTKHFKKHSAKQVRDEVGPIIGDLLYNEREHGALTEEKAKQVIERAKGFAGRPPRGGKPGGGRPGGGRPRGDRPNDGGAPRGGPRHAHPESRPPESRPPAP